MSDLLTYIVWPNPPAPSYDNPKVIFILLVCGALVIGSFAMKHWRMRLQNSVTKKLTRSYGPAMFWFGLTGFFMVICRTEGISYLSMRLWWGVWLAVALLFIWIQVKMFRARHYEIIPQEKTPENVKNQYLPKKKRR